MIARFMFFYKPGVTIAQALGLVKSYWPWAKIGVLGDGMCSTCDHDQFAKYVEEAEPVADQIVKLIEQ